MLVRHLHLIINGHVHTATWSLCARSLRHGHDMQVHQVLRVAFVPRMGVKDLGLCQSGRRRGGGGGGGTNASIMHVCLFDLQGGTPCGCLIRLSCWEGHSCWGPCRHSRLLARKQSRLIHPTACGKKAITIDRTARGKKAITIDRTARSKRTIMIDQTACGKKGITIDRRARLTSLAWCGCPLPLSCFGPSTCAHRAKHS